MKNTGIVRKFDDLGRIGVPKEIRDKFAIIEKTPMSISVSGKKIILEKVEDSCLFCESEEKLLEFRERLICENCMTNIRGIEEKTIK